MRLSGLLSSWSMSGVFGGLSMMSRKPNMFKSTLASICFYYYMPGTGLFHLLTLATEWLMSGFEYIDYTWIP